LHRGVWPGFRVRNAARYPASIKPAWRIQALQRGLNLAIGGILVPVGMQADQHIKHHALAATQVIGVGLRFDIECHFRTP
jgi:hypothetical protein